MVRINLLPPEIIEKRKYDRFLPYIFVAAAILVGVIVVVWGMMQFFVSQRTASLQQTQESTRELTEQAQALAVFDQREAEAAARQKAAQDALAGRVNIGRLAEELSLVLPDEVWLDSLLISESTGIQFKANTPEPDNQTMDEGYKSVAATLVRVNSLEQTYDVWLSSASLATFTGLQPRADYSSETSIPVVAFESTAKISRPGVPATTVTGQ